MINPILFDEILLNFSLKIVDIFSGEKNNYILVFAFIVAGISIISSIIVNLNKISELISFWSITRKDNDRAGNIIAYYSSVKSSVKGMNNTMFAANILNIEENFRKIIAIFIIDLMINGKLVVKNNSVSFALFNLNKYQRAIINELFNLDNLCGLIVSFKKLRARCLTVSYVTIKNIEKIINDAIDESGYIISPEDAWYLSRWFERKWKETPMEIDEIVEKHLNSEMINLRYIYSIIYK